MLEPDSQKILRKEIQERVRADRALLDNLTNEIRPLFSTQQRINPRSTTSISLVGTDGGNNQIEYDPFLVQFIRVVDSSNNEYCLEVISPTTSSNLLTKRHVGEDGSGITPLGNMMVDLGVKNLRQLSPMIKSNEADDISSPSWVQVYRELTEWAILYSIIKTTNFGADTLIVFDGLLRSKVFSGGLFISLCNLIESEIARHKDQFKRNIYLVGFAKHSKVLSRYKLAMSLENILNQPWPSFVEIPRDIEAKAYVWSEYARGGDQVSGGGESNKFVGGKMFFAKFGSGKDDPIWPVDILEAQVKEAEKIFGYLLADAIGGFPVPYYPLCLQKAHENAALVDFDFDIMQDEIIRAIREVLGTDKDALDRQRLASSDPARQRY